MRVLKSERGDMFFFLFFSNFNFGEDTDNVQKTIPKKAQNKTVEKKKFSSFEPTSMTVYELKCNSSNETKN